jgi:hypothetical protein
VQAQAAQPTSGGIEVLKITTARDAMGGAYGGGARSWGQGLTPLQQAQLRSIEGAGGLRGEELAGYAALNPNSNVQQYARAQGGQYNPSVMSNGMQQPMQQPMGGPVQAQPVGQPTTWQPNGPMQNPVQNQVQAGGYVYKGVGPEGNAVFTDPTTGERFLYDGAIGENYQVGQSSALPEPMLKTGLAGAEEALQGGLRQAVKGIDYAHDMGRADLNASLQGANDQLQPYASQGQGANAYQSALAGAQGQAAQQQAYDRFIESPGQQYLREQAERALTRNAAATGGLQGGNVLQALQRNAIGLAAQDFDNSFNRLGSLSDRGLSAAGQMGSNQINVGNALAGLSADAGRQTAGYAYDTGAQLAAGRTRAGENLANNIAQTTGNLANTVSQTGQSMAGVIGQGGSNLANLLAGAGRDMSTNQANYAQMLANLATGSGGQVAGLPTLGQPTQTTGILGGIGDVFSGIGGMATGFGWGA